MAKHNNYYEDEEYYGRPDRSRSKKSRHKKSRREEWAELEMAEETEEMEMEMETPAPSHTYNKPKTTPQPREIPQEALLEIKKKDGSVKIDLTRVDAIDCIDGAVNAQGKQTYGVKFTYSGNKGYGYTQWFGPNKFLRDKNYNEWHDKWLATTVNK